MNVKSSWKEPINSYAARRFSVDMEMFFNPLNVKIKRLSDTAILPTYGSAKAAGMDLYADIKSMGTDKVYLGPNDCLKIPIGFAFELPEGYCSLILARSGLATKKGLRPANCVGLCDEDYRGNYIVAIRNDSNEMQVIEHGDRIAQLMFVPYVHAELTEVNNLSETDRDEGGFGSTGNK